VYEEKKCKEKGGNVGHDPMYLCNEQYKGDRRHFNCYHL